MLCDKMSTKVAANDDECDIYSDLPNFQVTESISKLETRNKCLIEEKRKLSGTVEELQKIIDIFRKQKAELESKNKRLSLNMSSLYKTAATELRRKDRMIEELRRERDNVVFRRHSFRNNEERYERYEHRRKRRHSDPSSVDWNETNCKAKEKTHEKLKTPICSKKNAESNYLIQNEHNKVVSDIVVTSTKKHVPSYSGPVTEYSKRMFAKLHGISVDEINRDMNTSGNCKKEQKYKDIINNERKQSSETKKCSEISADNPSKSETEANTANMSKLVTTPPPKTPAVKKLKTPKLDRRCLTLRGKQHPTDFIKLGAQNIVKSEEKKNVQENLSGDASKRQRITSDRQDLNNPKDEMIQDFVSKIDSPTTENTGNLNLDTGQECEPQESSQNSKQDQSRIKQLLHDSHKFLTKAKNICSNKLVINPISEHSESISTELQEDTSSPNIEKLKLVNNKSPSVSTKPSVINSNKKSRQAQLLASMFNSPEPNKLRSDSDSNAITSKTAKSTLSSNVSSTVKSNKPEKTPPKGQLDDNPADITPRRQTNLAADIETKIPGDIISPILAKISENVCKLSLIKNKTANHGVPVNTTKCLRLAAEKLIHNVTESSCSIMGEDTLGMVTSLARPRQTVSPIKTPDKEGPMDRNSQSIGQKDLLGEKISSLNFSAVSKHSLAREGTEIKSSYLPSSLLVNRNQSNELLKKHGISVCLFSEHGEFKRKRRVMTPVTSETDDGSPEKWRRLEDDNNIEKQNGNGFKVRKRSRSEENEKINYVCNNKTIHDRDRNRQSHELIDLNTADSKNNNKIEKVENNFGKESNEEVEILRKNDIRSPDRKGRDSHSRRRSSRRYRYSPYRHRRRSPFRSSERNMRRRSPGYLRYSDRQRSRRSRSVTPIRFRSRRSRSYSPIRLRSKRSVSLSPCRQLKKERYLVHSKISYNTKTQEKIENRLHDDDFSEHVGKKELGDEASHKEITELKKSKSSAIHDVENRKIIDRPSIQQSTDTDKTCTLAVNTKSQLSKDIKPTDFENNKVINSSSTQQITNIDETCTLAVNTKSALSKFVKTNMVSMSGPCSDDPVRKLDSEINITANKTEKECTDLKNNVVTLTAPDLKITNIPPSIVIMKRRPRKVVRLQDNDISSTVSIKSPKNCNDAKLQAYSDTKEQNPAGGDNTVCVSQEQKETMTVTKENVNLDHKSVHDHKTVESKVTENIVPSDIGRSDKVFCATQEQKEMTCIVMSENVNMNCKILHDDKAVKSKITENAVSLDDVKSNKLLCALLTQEKKETTCTVASGNVNVIHDNETVKSDVPRSKKVNDKTSDMRQEVKDNDFVLTRENIKKLNNYYSSNSKKAPQTSVKKQLYMTLFGTPNSKCSSDSTETEEGELSSSDEGEKD